MLKNLFPKDAEVAGQKLNYSGLKKNPKVTELLNCCNLRILELQMASLLKWILVIIQTQSILTLFLLQKCVFSMWILFSFSFWFNLALVVMAPTVGRLGGHRLVTARTRVGIPAPGSALIITMFL